VEETMSASAVLTRLEKELREVWSADEPRTRACTMNLVVVTGSTELAERYTQVVDDVTRSIPARAIVVALDADGPDALEGQVTAVCGVDDARTICSERVSLTARGGVVSRVASVVDTLRVAELPTALVWLGRVHASDPVFEGIAEDAQRVVLDTEYTSIASLLQLARWASAEEGRPHVADLAWTRIAVWQEMCARFFDAPRLREHALKVNKLVLKQASDPGAPLGSEGALMLGWIATRLGWTIARVGGKARFRRPDGGTMRDITVELGAVARPPEVAPLALASIAIEAESGGIVAKGSIERELASGVERQLATGGADTADKDVLVWRLDCDVPSATEQRVRLRANKGARLLERTLHRPPRDPALVEAAMFAEQVLADGVITG
jgi:glucose-6-phosphate dehydrogenase assembly protein OpcA